MLFRKAKVSLYIIFFLFFFLFSFVSRFIFHSFKIIIVYLNRFQAGWIVNLCFICAWTLMKFGNFFGICFTSTFIKISMNLFDQLVIVIDDPNMEG